jgi:uncharacterized protein (TIGR00251 family)
VSPGASRSEVVGRHGDAWKVRVTAPAESGRTNEAVVDLLAATLEVSRSCVEIVGGRASRDKTVVVDGLAETDVEARLLAPTGAR